MQKLKMHTPNIADENFKKLAALFPNAVTETTDENGKVVRAIDKDVLMQEINAQVVDDGQERYQFTWPDKRKSVVLANAPIAKTLRFEQEKSVGRDGTPGGTDSENIYIEGDNLDVLKILQETYLGKVKMIYIDPPYNTGNDFIYEDDFRTESLEWRTESGEYDEEGNRLVQNSESNGRFHTDWLNMIYPRLRLAKDLLSDDGVIFISIDDNEQDNLKKICDEVFGSQNFIAQLVWERAYSPKNDARFISNSHDYILMFAKNIDNFVIGRLPRTEEANARYSNPDNDPRGVWKPSDMSVKTYNAASDYPITTPSGKVVEPPAGRCWSLSAKAFAERLQDNRIWFGPKGDSVPCIKRFLSELKFDGMAPTSILFYKEVGHSQEGAQEVVSLFGDKGVFDGPKPVRLLERLLTLANLKDDSIVLDFFSGSATTAHSLIKRNVEKQSHCKFILVQIPEKINEKKKNQGYKTICDIGEERIRRAGRQILELSGENLELSLENLEKEGLLESLELSRKNLENENSKFQDPSSKISGGENLGKGNAGKLSEIRSLEEVYGLGGKGLSVSKETSEGGALRSVGSDEAGGGVDSVEHSGRSVEGNKGVYPVFESGKGITSGTGDTIIDLHTLELLNRHGYRVSSKLIGRNQQDALFSDADSKLQTLSSKLSVLSSDIDYGFRCFRVDSSNMKDVYYRPADIGQMNLDQFTDNIKEDRTPEDLLIQVMLDLGVLLSSKVEKTEIAGKKVFSVSDGYLIACFDKDVTEDVVTAIAKQKPFYAVFRDSSMANDSVAANFEQIFATYSPQTVRKVL